MTSPPHLDYDEILKGHDPTPFADDPLPGWAGIGTLFGATYGNVADLSSSTLAVASVPFDGTASSRPGAAQGPRAIRAASQIYASNLSSAGIEEMFDTRTGAYFIYSPPEIVDVGDFRVYPTDTLMTFRSAASASRALCGRAAAAIYLIGDHSMTFATFAGARQAWSVDFDPARIGFVNVDHHFDFGRTSKLHGPIYHGSNSRRISELPGMKPENVAFIGVGDVTKASQYRQLLADGYRVVSVSMLNRLGVADAVAPTLESLAESCDVVYVSLDVDVLDASVAPGTGNVTVGGLSSAQLFDLFDLLRALPVRGWDVAEVAPNYDPTGRTSQLMAKLLFEQLFRSPFDSAP
jgi:arginase family enzyme